MQRNLRLFIVLLTKIRVVVEKLSQTQSAWSDGSKPGSLSKVSSFQSHCVSPSSERGHLFPQDVVRGALT